MSKVIEAVSLRRWVHGAIMTLGIGLSMAALAAENLKPEALYLQAKELLRQGHADQAYALLSAQEGDLSGEDAFDYLLGVAALDAQQAGEAIFSLQRLVSRKPDFAGARLELARAYFDVGDNELARIEFDRVLTENPPPNVVAAVTEYQAAIDARSSAYETTSQYYFDFGGGYDSNAPAATDEQIFLGFQLSDSNLAQATSFADMAVGGFINRPITPASSLLVTGRLDHRSNPSTHFVDASNLDLGVAWNFSEDNNSFSLAANNLISALDRKYSRRDTALMATYIRRVGKTTQFSTFARSAVSRFDGAALSVRDVDQVMYGVSAVQSFAASQMTLTLTKNADTTVESTSPYSTDGFAVSLSNSWFLPGGVQYTVDASVSKTEYDDPFFGFDRKDNVYSITGSGVWMQFPAKDWVTTARINYSLKDSTVSLFEFDRLEAGVSFRKILD